MKGLRRELFRCFSCILILGSKQTNFSHKKTLHGEHLCHSIMHEITFAARFHWRRFVSLKNEIGFFFQQIPDTECTLGAQLKLWLSVESDAKKFSVSKKLFVPLLN